MCKYFYTMSQLEVNCSNTPNKAWVHVIISSLKYTLLALTDSRNDKENNANAQIISFHFKRQIWITLQRYYN